MGVLDAETEAFLTMRERGVRGGLCPGCGEWMEVARDALPGDRAECGSCGWVGTAGEVG